MSILIQHRSCHTLARSLGGRAGFGSLFAVAFIKPINPASCVDKLLLASEKRMARRADFNVKVAFSGGAGLERFAAGASDGDLVIRWMNFWLHYYLVPS